MLYGELPDAQPLIGFLTRREGILGTGSVKLDANWVLTGGARYDLDATKFNQIRFGVGYIDDCFIMSLNYIADYNYSGNVRPTRASYSRSACVPLAALARNDRAWMFNCHD